MARKPKVEVVAERTEICKNCRHAEFGDVIHCHRYPPKPATDAAGAHVDSHFPVVFATWYCGEFAAHLSS